MREWGAEWLDRREASGVRAIKDDRTRWRVHVSDFAPWIDAPLASVTRAQAREWWTLIGQRRSSSLRHKDRGRPLEAQTLRNILNLVRRCFADAYEDELIPVNPFEGLRVHRSRRASTRVKSTVAEPDERAVGLAAVPYPERWMVEVALGSGMRQGEQWSLLLADLHLDAPKPWATVRFGNADGPTKGGQVHEVWIFGMALTALRAWLAQLSSYAPKNPLGLVFPTRNGKRRAKSAVFRSFERFGRAIGRHFRWHDCRHTCGTALIAGWDGPAWSLEAVCDQFGHSSTRVTERYARIAARVAGKAAARMAPERVPVHVPVFARRPRARRAKRGKEVESTNDVDGGEKTSENAGDGAVAKWLGIGLQNREPPPDELAECRARVADCEAEIAELLVLLTNEKRRANENAEAHFGALKDCEALRVQLVAAQQRVADAARWESGFVEMARKARDELATEKDVAKDRLGIIHDLRAELALAHRATQPKPESDRARALVWLTRVGSCTTPAEVESLAEEFAKVRHEGASDADAARVPVARDVSRLDVVSPALHAEGVRARSAERAPSSASGVAVGSAQLEVGDRVGVPGGRTLGTAALKFAIGDRVRLIAKVACLAPVGSCGTIERSWPAYEAGGRSYPETFHVDELTDPQGQRYPGIVVPASVLDIVPTSPLGASDVARLCDVEPEPAHRASSPTYTAEGEYSPSAMDRQRLDPSRKLGDPGCVCGCGGSGGRCLRSVPDEAFKATELSRTALREQPTRPELADADDGEERATLHLHREELLTLARTRTNERDAARALVDAAKRERLALRGELLALQVRHRTAIGLLNDVDRAGVRVATFLSDEVKS